MYCIKCGVELAEHEKKCPLCGTPVPFTAFVNPDAPAPYPKEEERDELNRHGVLFVLTFLFLIPIVLSFVCDLSINGAVVWSGYSSGALLLGYTVIVLPMWFRFPNAVIFVPVDFAAAALYLCYINNTVGGSWFLTFALPITVMTALIVCSVITLLRYVKRGRFFVFGGASLALGLSLLATELFGNLTFGKTGLVWSAYPLTVFVLLGIMFIVIAMSPKLRDSLRRKFFV